MFHFILFSTMAKGVGLIGNIKGKLGNAVGYQIRNSNNRTTQGWRVYQPEVANPKTTTQAAQRMKMAPAVMFYRALSGILDHSWEGIKYGGDSHQYFMKMVMRNTFTAYPYLPKGTSFMVPGAYPVSRGSIQGPFVSEVAGGVAHTNITQIVPQPSTTLGQYSQALINANGYLQDGDQITIIMVTDTGNPSTPYATSYERLVLDTTSVLPLASVAMYPLINHNSDEFWFLPAEGSIVAAAIILSRLSDGAWLRSSSDMVLSTQDSNLNDYFTEQQRVFARKSYEEQLAITSSKWYLNQADTPAGSTQGGSGANGGNLLVMGTIRTAGGGTAPCAVYNGAEQQGFLLNNPSVVNNPSSGTGTIEAATIILEGRVMRLQLPSSYEAGQAFVEYSEVEAELLAAGYTLDTSDARP